MGLRQSAKFSDVVDEAYVSNRISVGTTQVEAKAGASALSNRQELIIFNDGNRTVYFGPTGVTSTGATKGIPIDANETVNIQVGDSLQIFLITDTSTSDVIIQEFA